MRPLIRTIAIAGIGVIVGAIVTLSMPSPGAPPDPTKQPSVPAVIEKVRAQTLLAWTPVRLPAGLAHSARSIDGVEAVAEVRSGIAWLESWTTDDGRGHRSPEGFRIPVEIAAVDPQTYVSFVPSADRAAISQLASGGIVLGNGGAALRDVQTKGALDIEGSPLDVLGVVDDGLIGAHEAVVSLPTGRSIGITRARYLLVALTDDASMDDVERDLRSTVGAGTPVRIRAPGETPEFRHGDAVLPPVRLKEIFGEFAAAPSPNGNLSLDQAWVRANLTSERVPVIGSVTCHRQVIPQLRAALEEIVRRGLAGEIDASDFGGCYFPRHLSQDEDAGLSHHSWGIAVDLNVSENPFGQPSRMDERIIEVFERWGFTWGGRWLVGDAMHFEFLRFPLSPKG